MQQQAVGGDVQWPCGLAMYSSFGDFWAAVNDAGRWRSAASGGLLEAGHVSTDALASWGVNGVGGQSRSEPTARQMSTHEHLALDPDDLQVGQVLVERGLAQNGLRVRRTTTWSLY